MKTFKVVIASKKFGSAVFENLTVEQACKKAEEAAAFERSLPRFSDAIIYVVNKDGSFFKQYM